MRYLSLAEAMVVAEAVTGIDARSLIRASRVELLDSALHAPAAGFGDDDLYPDLVAKAAVLAVRIAKNHPLPDGNKRLAWACLNLFCELNGAVLRVDIDDAVATMLGVAAGEIDQDRLADWIRDRLVDD